MNAKIMLMLQLIRAIEENFGELNNSYNSLDKENFEVHKKNILELNKKINLLLKQNVY